MHWTRLFNQAQPSGADGHQRQFSGHPGLTPACSKFFLTVIRGMVKSSMLKTYVSSPTALELLSWLGIGALITFGVSTGGSNSICLASIMSWILFFKAQQLSVSCPGLLEIGRAHV